MAHPTPYNYPPWEIVDKDSYDPSYSPAVACDQNVGFFSALHTRQGFTEGFGLSWFPLLAYSTSTYCDLSLVSSAPYTWGIQIQNVPKCKWTKSILTVNLHSELVPSDLPDRKFFSETNSVQSRPWALSFVPGSSNSDYYKKANAEGYPRSPVDAEWNYLNHPKLNTVLMWRALEDFVAQCSKVETFSTLTPNDTWRFTLDMSPTGIEMNPGDKIQLFWGAQVDRTRVRSMYLKHEFQKMVVGSQIPLVDAGYRASSM